MLIPNNIYCGNSLELLKEIDNDSINCCVTSPPYWALRDYGTENQIWDGDKNCDHAWGNNIKAGGRVGTSWNSKGLEKRLSIHLKTFSFYNYILINYFW